MERRLLKAIMNPAMIVAWMTGLYMAWASRYDREIWFHTKFLMVLGLTGVHFYLRRLQLAFADGERLRTGRFFRVLNEVPTLLMVGIVLMVVVRPF
jgi:putative membrane protein